MIPCLARSVGITALLVACVIYPFIPGDFDATSIALSIMAQTIGVLGSLLMAPVGLFWLVAGTRAREHYLAIAAAIASSAVAIGGSLAVYATAAMSLALLLAALGLYASSRLLPRPKRLKAGEPEPFNPAPVYLLFIPIAVLVCQLMLASPLTEFSRSRAIESSSELINDIEAYRARHGRYPAALSAVWKDYQPGIVGVDRFHYAAAGDAYNLFFEQPRFLLDNIGTREFVVYNNLDQHTVVSHTAWILDLTPAQLVTNQGWYAVHQASIRHWKYFWFD